MVSMSTWPFLLFKCFDNLQVLFNLIRKGSLIFRGFEWPKSMVINMPVPLPVPLEFLWELLVVEISGLQKQKQEGGPPPNSESDVIYSLTKLTGISVCLSLSYSLFLSLFCFFQSKFKKIQAFSQQLASVYGLVPWRFNGRHHLQSTRGVTVTSVTPLFGRSCFQKL